MKTKKEKKKIIIITSVVLAILIIGILTVLYITTDMFKSKQTLFAKYMVQALSQMGEIAVENNLKEAKDLLEKNKYLSNIEGAINYSENGNTDNEINNLKLKIDSQIDKASQYEYRNIQLQENEQKIVETEYLKEKDILAARLDGIKQFVKTGDMKESEKQNEKIKEINIKQLIEFSEEEKVSLQNKYLNIVNQNISADNYSKQSGKIILVNNKKINANEYSIKLTKEKFNDVYIKILEQLKTDEIILNKIQSVFNLIKETSIAFHSMNIKEQYIAFFDSIIEEIKDNNIGKQERIISVYESQGKTVKISVQTEENTFDIDLVNEINNKIIGIKSTKISEKENSIDFKIERKIENSLDSIEVNIKDVKEGVAKNIKVFFEEKIENNNLARNISLALYNESANAELKINENTTMVNEFTDKIELSDDNYIDLSTLSEKESESIQNILNEKSQNISRKVNQKMDITIIYDMFISTGWLKEGADSLESSGNITETEKVRFNSQFEFFEGEEVNIDSIKQLANIVQNNLDTIKITQYKEKKSEKDPNEPKEYKMIIKKDNNNENATNAFLNYIEKEKNATYNVEMEYNDETGLIENIIILLNE